MFNKFHMQPVLRWRMFLKHYGDQLQYIKVKFNILINALSCLPCSDKQSTPNLLHACAQTYHSMAIDYNDLLDCFADLPFTKGVPFILTYEHIFLILFHLRILISANEEAEYEYNTIVPIYK